MLSRSAASSASGCSGSAPLPTSAPSMTMLARIEAPSSKAISVALIIQALLESSFSVLSTSSVLGYSAAPVVTASGCTGRVLAITITSG